MELDYGVLAATATRTPGAGALVDLDKVGLDLIRATGVPLTVPIVVAARVIWSEAELEQPHDMTAALIAPNGNRVEVGEPMVLPIGERKTNWLAPLDLRLEEFGTYQIELVVDGQILKTFTLKLQAR